MNEELSPKTKQLLASIQDEAIRAGVMEIFESKPALYAPPSAEVLERVRFAVIKLALQGPKMLKLAAKFYEEDTRDLLVSAEFGLDPDSDKAWAEAVIKKENA